MLIDEALKIHLLAQAGLTALVGNRICPPDGQESKTNPVLHYEKTDGDRASGLVKGQFQFVAWARPKGLAKAIAAQVCLAFKDYINGDPRVKMGGAQGIWVQVAIPETDGEDVYNPETKLYGVEVDITVWYVI